jgi:hypothetical protein
MKGTGGRKCIDANQNYVFWKTQFGNYTNLDSSPTYLLEIHIRLLLMPDEFIKDTIWRAGNAEGKMSLMAHSILGSLRSVKQRNIKEVMQPILNRRCCRYQ